MDMLLSEIRIVDLATMLEAKAGRSPIPLLKDSKVVARARDLARANGIWDSIERNLDPAKAIPVVRRSAYRQYDRTGDREVGQKAIFERDRDANLAFLALWLGHPRANLDYLQDHLWAACDDFEWQLPAHERGGSIDLFSADKAARLAEMLHVLGPRLEDEVRERVRSEIERRVFRKYGDPSNHDYWKTHRNNWNHVCNGSMIRAALLLISDSRQLANMIHPLIQNMSYGLDGFAADGGCWEGPGYWGYGFGHFMHAALLLRNRTGGALNLMSGEKIGRICRYPLAAWIENEVAAPFSDVSTGFLPGWLAMLVNEFHAVPELYTFCRRNADGTLRLGGLQDLALAAARRPARRKIAGINTGFDYHLSAMGQVKLWGGRGAKRTALVALAGNNGVPHNHNDVGTFVVYRKGRLLLTDPGAPLYTRKTFSPQRYEILFCNSFGHSVPVVNGRGQPYGESFCGTMVVENPAGAQVKRATIDMARAYDVKALKKLERSFAMDTALGRIVLEDRYEFAAAPRSLEEAFITYERVRVEAGGRAVRIGAAGGGLLLKAANPGRFAVKAMVEESKEGRTGQAIQRITFKPRRLAKQMTLRFEML